MTCRENTVSPQLQRALIGLDDAVKLLSANMDAVVFRETWKAIAVAINRHLYNEVATETRFSHQVHSKHVPHGACVAPVHPRNCTMTCQTCFPGQML